MPFEPDPVIHDIALPEAHAFELCENLPEMLERVLITFFDDDITHAALYKTMRESLDTNILSASGYRTDIRYDRELDLTFPAQSKIKKPSELVDAYFNGTALHALFYTKGNLSKLPSRTLRGDASVRSRCTDAFVCAKTVLAACCMIFGSS